MANSSSSTQYRNRIASNNPIESGSSFSDIPGSLVKNVTQNLSEAKDDLFSQLLGVGKFEKTDQPTENDEVKPYQKFTLYDSDRKAIKADTKPETPKVERKPAIAAAIDYHAEIVQGSERASRKENREIQMQIQEIMQELQRLISSSDKIIQMEYGSYQVSSAPKAVGTFHTNFLAWMLSVVRDARKKVEDAGAWLAVAKGKGNKRGYRQSSKSLGTSFTQSNERNVATQTG